jgi:hypothetical protein
VSLNVGSQIHLHGVKVFDMAMRLTHGMTGGTGGSWPYHWSTKVLSLGSLAGFLRGSRIIVIKDLMAFNQYISVQK